MKYLENSASTGLPIFSIAIFICTRTVLFEPIIFPQSPSFSIPPHETSKTQDGISQEVRQSLYQASLSSLLTPNAPPENPHLPLPLMATTHLKKPYSSLYSLLENEKTRYVRKYINRYLYYQYPLIVSGIARPRKNICHNFTACLLLA